MPVIKERLVLSMGKLLSLIRVSEAVLVLED